MSSPRTRSALGASVAVGLVAPTLAMLAVSPAHAADRVAVTDAQFRWGINDESNSAGYAPGTFNLFSAGKIGNPGVGGLMLKAADEGATWTNGAAAGWKATDGNVTIEKQQADGSYATTTWAGTNTTPAGEKVDTNGKHSAHQVVIDAGTGILDADADDARLSWDGDFSVIFYSGMTYFTVSDPQLNVEDGEGTLTATLGGYGTAMDDPTKWEALPDTEVTLATLPDVDVTPEGIEVTPDYQGVHYDAPTNATPQARTGANWGSFPQDFVDFQQRTGSSSYWYSSGGGADARKAARPLSVAVNASQTAGKVTVSGTEFDSDETATVTVEGTGFDPALATGTRPPLAGKPSGAYVAVGKYADAWEPSQGAPSTARVNGDVAWAVNAEDMETIGGPAAGAIELRPDGSFTAELEVDRAAIDAKATDPSLTEYGIYTYAGGGAKQAAYETFTPITFTKPTTPNPPPPAPKPSTVSVLGSGVTTYGSAGSLRVRVPSTGTVSLAGLGVTQRVAARGGVATVRVPSGLRAGRYVARVSYSGNASYAPKTVTKAVTVRKARTTLSTRWASKPRKNRKATLVVRTRAVAARPTGRIQVVLKKAGKRVQLTRTLQRGQSRVVLNKRQVRKLGTGRWVVRATYRGDANYQPTGTTIRTRVR
ncbi:HtaA domain-containing protein [Nocardioides insulae]|uniref:HtaA domain-containing protein n=1 Tax=Nocardioides insulae TaxID=394734 RepID=UPI0003F787CC|nr:HtaA domain-containing protein [Nocardioides insulae]